jgi:orotidine 5'-phosphate decarboxylase subfamily 2
MTFQEKLDAIVAKNNSLVCVGLDQADFAANQKIVEATANLVCAYKPNSAFYEAEGSEGIKKLKDVIDFIQLNYPHIPVILDAKRGDIGHTNKAYTQYVFNYLNCDAVTLHPYQGLKALKPFFDYKDKGMFILCRTSNPEAKEIQDLDTGGATLWQKVTEQAVQLNKQYKNIMLVVGATYPEELSKIRKIVGEMTLLVPGIGAQGGDVEASLRAGLNNQRAGMIINSSRAIMESADPGLAVKQLRDNINQYR